MTRRTLTCRTVAATAILALFPAFGAGGTCFMDMAAAPSPHDCCKKAGLTTAPPSCCTGAQVTVAAVSPHKTPRALPCPAVHAPKVACEASSVAQPSMVEVAAVALSPPLRLRI
jgi:hypothetical protein